MIAKYNNFNINSHKRAILLYITNTVFANLFNSFQDVAAFYNQFDIAFI